MGATEEAGAGTPDPARDADPEGADEGMGEAPPPFLVLCGSLAAQVQMALGLIPDPVEKKARIELAAAREGISLLDMLEAKTRGNLDDREKKTLADLLTYLRMLYVERVRQLQKKGESAVTPPPATPPPAGG